ncbi:MAG: hypothetical protein QM501_10940 [Gimesia sp.]
MNIEVACPACGGSIQIEEVSQVVACPLCQKHLEFDAETSKPVLVTEGAAEEDAEEESVPDESTETNDSPEDATAEQEETDKEQYEAEATSNFAFLPGGNQAKSEKTKPVRAATNFSFLPGGNDDSETVEAEPETSEVTSEEETQEDQSETSEEEISSEVESVPEQTPEEISEEPAIEETAAEEANSEESATEEDPAVEETLSEETTPEETSTEEKPTEAVNDSPEDTTADQEKAADSETNTPVEASTEPEPSVIQQNYRRGKVVPKRLFTLTVSYAIAATVLVAMLLYTKYLGDPHQLESLPDLKPPVKNDEIALQLVPENAELPAGHALKLGGPGRRFGNVMVTPLRVTRGPIEFEHYTGDSTKTREPSQDVLKLHLKFENVSSDQTFEPLDQKLLLTRVSGRTPEAQLRANNFICRVDQKRTDAERVLVYDMPPSWEWNLKGQNINQEKQSQKLEPGQSFETYVATNEQGIDSLTGDLVWRLQIRKGYNPKSFRGVTTLIEVLFNSDQIQAESPSPEKEELPTS